MRSVGDGVYEMRIQYGRDIGSTFIRRGSEIIVLICGGDRVVSGGTLRGPSGCPRNWRSDAREAN